MAKPEIKWQCAIKHGTQMCSGMPVYAVRWHARKPDGSEIVVLLCEDHKSEIVIEPYAERLGVACNIKEAMSMWEE